MGWYVCILSISALKSRGMGMSPEVELPGPSWAANGAGAGAHLLGCWQQPAPADAHKLASLHRRICTLAPLVAAARQVGRCSAAQALHAQAPYHCARARLRLGAAAACLQPHPLVTVCLHPCARMCCPREGAPCRRARKRARTPPIRGYGGRRPGPAHRRSASLPPPSRIRVTNTGG